MCFHQYFARWFSRRFPKGPQNPVFETAMALVPTLRQDREGISVNQDRKVTVQGRIAQVSLQGRQGHSHRSL